VGCSDRGGHNAASRFDFNNNIQALYMHSSLITNRVLEAFLQTRLISNHSSWMNRNKKLSNKGETIFHNLNA
jgi:hypothetical protein